jgi:cell division protein FtsW (lipid II flippase)
MQRYLKGDIRMSDKTQNEQARYDKKTRNRNFIKKMIYIFLGAIAVMLGNLISAKFFHGSVGVNILIVIVICIIMVPIEMFIEQKVDEKSR